MIDITDYRKQGVARVHDKPAKMDWESMSITVIILVLEESHHWAVADSDVKYACFHSVREVRA